MEGGQAGTIRMSTTQIVRLRYNGLDYGPDYAVRTDG